MTSRILIIDDIARWTDFVKDSLDTFEIIVAQDANFALHQLESNRFDLVILSSRYLDTFEAIKANHPDQPIIVVTVHPTTEEALRAYRTGALRYFAKPFNRNDLLNQINQVIPEMAETA